MDQNLMVQELSDNDLEQVVGGHCCKPKHPKWREHHFEHHCHEPKPCFPHFRHHCEPPIPCHVEPHCL
jgi:bacteriocin-like protein